MTQIDDLRLLGHDWAAKELEALSALRRSPVRGVRTERLPGWPAVLTSLGSAGFRTRSVGQGDAYRVLLISDTDADTDA